MQFIEILHTVPKWVLDKAAYKLTIAIGLCYTLCMLQHFV